MIETGNAPFLSTGLIAVMLPLICIVAGFFILIKIIDVLPNLLSWLNRPKIKNEYEERRTTGIISCPSKLRDLDILLDYEGSTLSRTFLGKVVGYTTLPSNTIILPDSPAQIKSMPSMFRILYYIPTTDIIINTITLGFFKKHLINDIVFTDKQTKAITQTSIILSGNSIEPMIGGGYSLLISSDTPVYSIDTSFKMRNVLAINSELNRVMKDIVENTLRLNPQHQANLEREGGVTEVPVNSPLPQQPK